MRDYMQPVGYACLRTLTMAVIGVVLGGCMAVPLVGLAAAGGGLVAGQVAGAPKGPNKSYKVASDYDSVFTAVQSAMASRTRLGISDRQTGVIQGQMGAAKTVTVNLSRLEAKSARFVVNVENTAGLYAFFDKSDEGQLLADRVASQLGVAVSPE